MVDANRQYERVIRAAREFCELIEEATDEDDTRWLNGMAELLPRLHAEVAALHGSLCAISTEPSANLEDRFEFYSRLKSLLGEKDGYWLEFDVAVDGQNMSGSLADDLTDIYFELKQGLETLDSDPLGSEIAISSWRSGYKLNWGQHLVDAERHIYTLCSRNELGR
ncbi:MAG: DUF5063 domain-containing protein [Chromatiales bacterium]|nr:DUF5063 domain-containing protein [Chromatiales bacterium]